jgi:putative membrane protein insertion efficiency factor
MTFGKKPLNKIALYCIYLYRSLFSPSVGIFRYIPFYPKHTCIFYPTCSAYGIEAFETYPFLTALRKTLYRISRCHPGNEPTIDHP